MLPWLRDERTTDTLLVALHDDEPEVREWAINALWNLYMEHGDNLSKEASEKMHDPVTQALHDEDNEVREQARAIFEWLAL